MPSRTELEDLLACVDRAEEDLGNWWTVAADADGGEDERSKEAADQQVQRARDTVERMLSLDADDDRLGDDLRRGILEEAGDVLGDDQHFLVEDEISASYNEGEDVQGTDNPNGWYVTARVYVHNWEYADEDDRLIIAEPLDTYEGIECGS